MTSHPGQHENPAPTPQLQHQQQTPGDPPPAEATPPLWPGHQPEHQPVFDYVTTIETATIAGLIWQPHHLAEIQHWLRPDDFRNPLYTDWYTLLLDMHHNATPIDPVTVLTQLRHHNMLGPGGQHAHYLTRIITGRWHPGTPIHKRHRSWLVDDLGVGVNDTTGTSASPCLVRLPHGAATHASPQPRRRPAGRCAR